MKPINWKLLENFRELLVCDQDPVHCRSEVKDKFLGKCFGILRKKYIAMRVAPEDAYLSVMRERTVVR